MNRMKQVVCLTAAMLAVTASSAWGASIYYEGQAVPTDVPPLMIEGRTMVPLRLLESLGDIVVDWQQERRIAVVVTGTPDNVTAIGVPIDKQQAFMMTGTLADFDAIGGMSDQIDWNRVTTIPLDVPAQIIDGRTMVPLRMISETLGYQVQWEASTETVTIAAPAAVAE